jgi:hypothetical protein
MKYLKYFENNPGIFNIEIEDIQEIFSDFIDDFQVTVVFGKKLHQFNIVDTKITDQDIKLGFKYYSQVRLIPLVKKTPYELSGYINSDEFLERQSEVVSKLDYYDLELHKVFIESTPSSILFLIYSK